MEFPGGAGAGLGDVFGVGPYSHGLNPFDVTLDEGSSARGVGGGNFASSTGIGTFSAWDVRTMAHRSPVLLAGWGYDLFGRPAPNLQKTLKTLNGYTDDGNVFVRSYAESSNLFDDGRDDLEDNTNTASFPFGGHAAAQYYVGGALDVRYDARHGLWKTNHFVLAEIMGYTDRPLSEFSTYIRDYEWKEVEFGNAFADDVVRREDSNIDSLDYPARSYGVEGGKGYYVVNPAINLSEMGYTNILHGERPFLGPPVPSGSIVQLRTVNSIYNNTNYTTPALAGAYIFSFEVPNKVFVEIVSSQALDLVNDIDPEFPGGVMTGDQEIGTLEHPTTRWWYEGKVKRFRGFPTQDSGEGGVRQTPYGTFENDPNWLKTIRLINIIEYNNPLAAALPEGATPRMDSSEWNVSPGINMAPALGVYPSGTTIRPISNGTIIEATYMPDAYMPDELYTSDGTETSVWPFYYFQLANAHDGCCETGWISEEPEAEGNCVDPTDAIALGVSAGTRSVTTRGSRRPF